MEKVNIYKFSPFSLGESLPDTYGSLDQNIQSMGSWITTSGNLGSWTDDKKEEVLKSQVVFTQQLIEAIKKLKVPPKLFVCASEVRKLIYSLR